MKKLISVLVMLALLFTFGACGNSDGGDGPQTAQAYDIYTAANKSMQDVKSLAVDTKMTIDMEYDGETISMEMNGVIKEVIKSETDVDLEMIMTTVSAGETMDMVCYYTDGYYYMDIMGQKVKMAMPMDQIMDQTNVESISFEESAVKNQGVSAVSGGQELSFTLDGTALSDLLSEQMSSMTQQLGAGATMTFNDVDFKAVVDSEGNLTSSTMAFSFSMNVEGETINASAVADMTYTQLNSTTIELPADLDTYAEGSF